MAVKDEGCEGALSRAVTGSIIQGPTCCGTSPFIGRRTRLGRFLGGSPHFPQKLFPLIAAHGAPAGSAANGKAVAGAA